MGLDWVVFIFIVLWVSFAAFMPVFGCAIDANLSTSILLPIVFSINYPA